MVIESHVRERAASAGLSFADLGTAADVPDRVLFELWTGRHDEAISPHELARLCAVLACVPGDLLTLAESTVCRECGIETGIAATALLSELCEYCLFDFIKASGCKIRHADRWLMTRQRATLADLIVFMRENAERAA